MARALTPDTSVFAAIADPTRRAILDVLREQEASVSRLRELLGRAASRLSQPAFSQHLAVLKRAGLVASRRHGRLQVYRFRHEPLAEVAGWLAHYDRFWNDRLGELGRYLDRTRAGATSTRRGAHEPPSEHSA